MRVEDPIYRRGGLKLGPAFLSRWVLATDVLVRQDSFRRFNSRAAKVHYVAVQAPEELPGRNMSRCR